MVTPTSSPANGLSRSLGGGSAQSNKGGTVAERQGQLDCHSGLFGTLHFAFQLDTWSSRTRGSFLACPSRRRTFILGGVSDSHQPTSDVRLLSKFFESSPSRRGRVLARGQKPAGGQNGHLPYSQRG